ncbi:hypothetical protein VTN77DRAFT_487 [Rasamsonia byssochlamydoides]|uniref:uncharacterized protein n=1 Tax=Rasamsonia byssochlamydoides TaxID=89139 RepID=UPI003743A668
MFPTSVGARVFISGFIVVLFNRQKDIEESWKNGLVTEFGCLRLGYDIVTHEPTINGISSGTPIAPVPNELSSSAALGLKLRLPGGLQCIFTYDPPISHLVPFPFGFIHDLSLVTDNELPAMITPSRVPRIVGWGNYNDVLDGGSLFVTGFYLSTGNLRQYAGAGVSRNAQKAIAEGAEYLWDKTSCSQSASILWRTTYDGDSLQGLSGATLCLGRLSDQTCRAVCFQNFKTPLPRQHIHGDHRAPPDDTVSRPTLKGWISAAVGDQTG